jgi:hypothetical protein
MQHVGEDVARGLGDMARQLVESHFGYHDADSESSRHSEDEIDDLDTDLYVDDSIQNFVLQFKELRPK